jgi:hypothetical protein
MLARECVMSSKLRTFPGSLITRRFHFVEDSGLGSGSFLETKTKRSILRCVISFQLHKVMIFLLPKLFCLVSLPEVGLRRFAFFNKPSIPMSDIFYAAFQALELFSVEQQLLR